MEGHFGGGQTRDTTQYDTQGVNPGSATGRWLNSEKRQLERSEDKRQGGPAGKKHQLKNKRQKKKLEKNGKKKDS